MAVISRVVFAARQADWKWFVNIAALVPRTQRSAQHLRSGALQSRGRTKRRRSVRSRLCGAA